MTSPAGGRGAEDWRREGMAEAALLLYHAGLVGRHVPPHSVGDALGGLTRGELDAARLRLRRRGGGPAPLRNPPSRGNQASRATSTTKFCPRCEQQLPASAFNRNRASTDGLQPYCRPCQNGYKRGRNRERTVRLLPDLSP